MKENKRSAKLLPIALSLIWSVAVSVLFILMYGSTKYLPLELAALVLMMPALMNVSLLFALLNYDAGKIPVPSVKKESKLFFRILQTIAKGFMTAVRAVAGFIAKVRVWLSVLLFLASAVSLHIVFWSVFGRTTSTYRISYVTPVIIAAVFVTFVILEKWCAHSAGEGNTATDRILKNIRSYLSVSRFLLILAAVATVLKLLGFFELQKYLVYACAVVFCYETLFTVVSLTVRLIKRELTISPDISVPTPFAIGGRDLGVIAYLENSTGITMRSLWSIKLVKRLMPFAVIGGALLIWFCTGIVQVEPYQKAAVYRFGRLRSDMLEPGIHLTLPWPFDRTEVYNTEQVSKLTVGYVSSENTDNVWTSSHGSKEYRLLLGGGNELVSINLRIEYKIGDLRAYLKNSGSPEKILEAKAYELATDKIIVTDLNSLLAIDRSEFSETFKKELDEKINGYDTGLTVVSIVLESIHPPVEIASVYQELIGAQIDADKLILNAEAQAAVKIAEAEKQRDSEIIAAKTDSLTKKANANASVAEFMAGVAADSKYSDAYRYYKYMKAISEAYGGARLVIVGKGIDSSNIYFVPSGTFSGQDGQ